MGLSYKGELLTKEIIEKMAYILDGINEKSTREQNLNTSQAVQALSEAYKNLTGGRG